MKKKILFFILFVTSFAVYSQNIDNSIGSCETIYIDEFRYNSIQKDRVFWYYSFDGVYWNNFNFSQNEYNNGLSFRVDQAITVLSPDDNVKAYSGPLYIKGDLLTNVYSNTNPYLVTANCQKEIDKTPPNKPIPCNAIHYSSHLYSYNIIPCSPKLDPLTPPVPKDQSCSNKEDGQVEFFFNRPLEIGETYLFSRTLINTDDSDGPVTSTGADIDSSKMTTALSYTWKGIKQGKYKFFYQTYLNGNLRSKVDGIKPFTIGSPAKLVSTFEPLINPNCHDGDGSITIKTTGGTGNYRYKINTDEFKSFTNPTIIDGTTGIHSASQTIQLPSTITTEFKISVTDQEGCIESK
jgi:hypothetical protein